MKAVNFSSSAAATAAVDNVPYYRNSFDCFVKVLQQEGIRGLFRGLGASYFGVAEATMQWVAYEQFKRLLLEHRAYAKEDPLASTKEALDLFAVAATAKFVASITTYPHEVLRTRLRQVLNVEVKDPQTGVVKTVCQTRYKGMMDVFKTVAKEEGVLAFYGGMTAHLLRTVPNAAIMFLCYEYVVRFCQ
jgi:solute carrier family 25 protein 33/36